MDTFRVRITGRTAIETAAVLLAVAGLIVLSLQVSQKAFLDWDLQISQWVHSLGFPGLSIILSLANALTAAPIAITLWVIVMALLVLRGRPLEAMAVFSVSGIWLANLFLRILVDRPRPSPEIIEVVEFSGGASFPSGHVTAAITFYGLLTFLTIYNLRRGHLRIALPVLSVLIIGLTSLSRVYVGAHWPSDVLGAYLLGLIGLAGIAWVYSSIKEDTFHLPRLRRKQPAPLPDGIKIARSIASTVYLDARAGTAAKEYNPPRAVRWLYWLAFQAPFPYQHRREALEAAAANRKIASLLTKHQFGHDMVAAFYEIRNGGSNYQFVTELIPGTSPKSNREIEDTLSNLYSYSQEVGLPTWQISPGNPHAYSNFIRTPQGDLKLIDLESTLVSFSPPWKQLLAYLRDGHFPVFDDVDFVRLRNYVHSHASELKQSLGSSGLEELEQAIDAAERSTQAWKEREPRIWGRLASRVYRRLDMSKVFRGIGRRLDRAEAMAEALLKGGIDRWEREGRIDDQRAASLRETLVTSEVRSLLKHLGAHLVLSLALRFPFGSASRFVWVLTFRLKARYDLAKGRITKEEYRAARSVHSIPVMLVSLVPGLGTIAYFASSTMIRTGLARMLIDQFAYKLPFGLYRRLRLARITAPRLLKPAARAQQAHHALLLQPDKFKPGFVKRSVGPQEREEQKSCVNC